MKKKTKRIKESSQSINDMIKNIMSGNYNKASQNLSSIVDKKIQRRIINNNISIF